MKNPWKDPVKGHPAKESTMNTEGDFGKFTELMKRVVPRKHEEKSKKTVSSSPSPAAT
jgi:hypothetical protein